MIVFRCIESQERSQLNRHCETQAEYEFLENLIEATKPDLDHLADWSYVIARPFTYGPCPPQHAARCRPPGSSKNVFYAAENHGTALIEYAFHWMSERVGSDQFSETREQRSLISVEYCDPNAIYLVCHENWQEIMNRTDYDPSHRFIDKKPGASSVQYPSCRDPKHLNCVAVFEIKTLAKKIESESTVYFQYFRTHRTCRITILGQDDFALEVTWTDVYDPDAQW